MAIISADRAIPTMQSSAEDWIAWYNIIPGGREDKNIAFLAIWRKNGNSDANTHALRDFLKNEAGITLTTGGIGSITDAAYSAADKLESIAMIPVYALAVGSVMVFAIILFMGYQAFKNPEATGKIIGAAKMAAI